jgi:hypothetical protein
LFHLSAKCRQILIGQDATHLLTEADHGPSYIAFVKNIAGSL